ncbi:hypothetical protein ACJ5NV_09365 [Loktanella agnita]|uniref:hypothetical protein n=1 Tax=Loktanella agnita TaxID=287097 RepID=UPI00398647BF
MSRSNALLAVSRLAAEADRIGQIKDRSSRPEDCGEAIVDIAPARGPVQRFQPRETTIDTGGKVRTRRVGHEGQNALRRADAFDVMQQQSARCRPDAAPLFTAAQIGTGRDYAALYERCAAAGIRCSGIHELDSGSGGSGTGGQGTFIDAVIRDRRRLDAMERAIGTEIVIKPRGVQAHSDRGRKAITAHDLVYCVCLQGLTISQLLQRFGWSRAPSVSKTVRAALCGALTRLQGM